MKHRLLSDHPERLLKITSFCVQVLSNTIKQKRKEKAGKWEVPLPKVIYVAVLFPCSLLVLGGLAFIFELIQIRSELIALSRIMLLIGYKMNLFFT